MSLSFRLFVTLGVISFSFLADTIVHAQTTTATSSEDTESTIVETIGDRAADFRDRINTARQETIDTRNAALTERAQERITNLAANISNRFDAIIDRLQNIADRLQSRIEKLKVDGLDTTEAERSLEAANVALEDARSQLITIDADVIAVVGSTEPLKNWQPVKQSYLTARDSIRIAFQELKNVIISLKTANENPENTLEQATSTDVTETIEN